jgi:hypothetical protein
VVKELKTDILIIGGGVGCSGRKGNFNLIYLLARFTVNAEGRG